LTLTVTDSLLFHNEAEGGSGGNGFGGGLFNGLGAKDEVPTATLSNTIIVANEAEGGSGGEGVGGGIYNTGTVNVHKGFVKGNKATTSDDDIFGTVIPF